jgi:trimeric autotransporter adhesin
MKRVLTNLMLLLILLPAFAQSHFYFIFKDRSTIGVASSLLDSIVFDDSHTTYQVFTKDSSATLAVSNLDSLVSGDSSLVVDLQFSENSVVVKNPLAFEGVQVTTTGSDVVVNSVIDRKDIVYRLSGTSANGSFKLYSNRASTLVLNGVTLTNPDGPAINIQSHKTSYITLQDGKTNTLSDGTTYSAATILNGEAEDQKALFFSEGKLVFSGSGSLTLNGKGTSAHTLCSDESIEILGGIIAVASSSRDGIHGQEGFLQQGGDVIVASTGSCLDGDEGGITMEGGTLRCTSLSDDTNAINCDSTFTQSGGDIAITLGGAQSKGIKCNQDMTLSGGTLQITVQTSGKTVLETTSVSGRYDPAYCAAIKSGGSIFASGTNITVIHSGIGGKGITSDLGYFQTGGIVSLTLSGTGGQYVNEDGVTDYFNASGITSDGYIEVTNGTLTIVNSGTAGKGINSDLDVLIGSTSTQPTVSVTTLGSTVSATTAAPPIGGGGGGTATTTLAEPKGIKANGNITINGGVVTVASTDDGIKSDISVTFKNATVTVSKSTEGVEAPKITVQSGTVNVTSSDDAFNATYGNGGETNDGSLITLAGGRVNLNATGGDALDSNGSIAMSGGVTVVQGPTSQPEVAIDVNGTYTITGGFMVASGPSSGSMIEPTSSDWSTASLYCLLTSSTSIGTNLFHIRDAAGNEIATFKPIRSAYYIYVISPSFKSGTTYNLYTGGSYSSTATNGFYTGGTYTLGTLKKSVTLSSSKFVSTTF